MFNQSRCNPHQLQLRLFVDGCKKKRKGNTDQKSSLSSITNECGADYLTYSHNTTTDTFLPHSLIYTEDRPHSCLDLHTDHIQIPTTAHNLLLRICTQLLHLENTELLLEYYKPLFHSTVVLCFIPYIFVVHFEIGGCQ